ncbi:MAG: CPXCG motif-containing cysteine-rich protein [Gemmatimonadales bacterium]
MIGPPDPPDPLDEEFPLGDGVADLEAEVSCPHCGESMTIALDPGSGESQEYVEDCQVCCQPWKVTVSYGPEGAADVWVEAL